MQEASQVVNNVLTQLLTSAPSAGPGTAGTSTGTTGQSGQHAFGTTKTTTTTSSSIHIRETAQPSTWRVLLLSLQQLLEGLRARLLAWQPQAGMAGTQQYSQQYSRQYSRAHQAVQPQQAGSGAESDIQLVQCPLLNISVCAVTVAATAAVMPAHSSTHKILQAATAAALAPADNSNEQVSQHGGHKAKREQQQQQHPQKHQQLRVLHMEAAAAARHHSMHSTRTSDIAASRIGNSSSSNGSAGSGSGSIGGSSNGGGLLVMVYNSLGWTRRELVRVPVTAAAGTGFTVQGEPG